MLLQPIRTPLLTADSSLALSIAESASFREGDILAVSAKAASVTEGATINLSQKYVSPEAEEWAQHCSPGRSGRTGGRTPAFRQAVLDETKRMNGTVIGSCPQAMLCELKPSGFQEGTILAVNAGLDCSNIQDGYAIGWPLDPVRTVRELREEIASITGKRLAVILTDSCCRPRRLGLTAIALTVCGIDPLQSQIGKRDLFGRELAMTHEAVADQLATAANFLMGNANQSIPATLFRDHDIPLTDFCGWVPGISREEDLFRGLL